MIEINGNATDKLNLNSFRHVSDLIYYDGPLLSYFQDEDGESYLFSWVDCDNEYNRWLIVHTSFTNVYNYIKREISLRAIILNEGKGNLYVVDINKDVNYHHLMSVEIESLPAEYIPSTDKLYDYEPQNNEQGFLKKIESYGKQHGPFELVGKFDVLNAKTGLYFFEDMYSLDTSCGRFTEPYRKTVRDFSLNSSYVIVVDKINNGKSPYKAADKILSVELVTAD